MIHPPRRPRCFAATSGSLSRAALVATTLLMLAVALAWFAAHPRGTARLAPAAAPRASTPPNPAADSPTRSPSATPSRPSRPHPVVVVSPDPGRSPLADALNSPDGTIRDDVKILRTILANYLLALGANPVGTNREITAQLTGRNARRHAPLPRDAVAINAAGQLVDRWGTPFFFHALDRRHMEIRSAGPDREFYTADDTDWTPPTATGNLVRR